MGKSKKAQASDINKADIAVSTDCSNDDLFKAAVLKCDEIKGALSPELTAMKGNSKVVKVKNSKLINGSIDIDDALRYTYPNDSRWDYVVGYDNEVFFIEVHPAATSNVGEMINKVNWLKKMA